MVDFFVDTYKMDCSRDKGKNNETKAKPGRPQNDCIQYLDEHPKSKQKIRVIQSTGHKISPTLSVAIFHVGMILRFMNFTVPACSCYSSPGVIYKKT